MAPRQYAWCIVASFVVECMTSESSKTYKINVIGHRSSSSVSPSLGAFGFLFFCRRAGLGSFSRGALFGPRGGPKRARGRWRPAWGPRQHQHHLLQRRGTGGRDEEDEGDGAGGLRRHHPLPLALALSLSLSFPLQGPPIADSRPWSPGPRRPPMGAAVRGATTPQLVDDTSGRQSTFENRR